MTADLTAARGVWRLRLLAVCALLTAVAFVQRPGWTATDTKLDLTEAPGAFLLRSLDAWEPLGFAGQLQNQAYGYLVPTGPFFWLADLAGVPAWVAQRLWWTLLLCVAFLGMVRLAGRLGAGGPWIRLVAGLVYALSPRVLTLLGEFSVEAWPMAMAPWVLLPLVDASRSGSVRRGAAASGVALLLTGGVNAVATLAVLVLPAWFLLTREPGPRRRALMGWWTLAVALASIWWVLPLLVLARYSPPFLDWIEDAGTTTAHTSVAETLGGVSHWLAYLATTSGPALPAGFLLVTTPVIVAEVLLLAALGIGGLARPGILERGFLVGGVLLGCVLVGFGHVGALDGVLADARQAWLDGALAPFRNTHKFDAVLRIPLVLGLTHLLARAAVPGMLPRQARRTVVFVTAAALVGTATPALAGRVVGPGAYTEVPDYWPEVADWLAEEHPRARALVVPSASFAEFYWGRTRDDPLQPHATSPWAVRDAVPLGSAGGTRLLDGVGRRIDAGQGSPGLAEYLGRAGFGAVVVRNDLDWTVTGAPRPARVREALAASPGIELVASFGPSVGGGADTPQSTVDSRLDLSLPAVEVWEVRGPDERLVVSRTTEGTLSVDGGPEALLALADAGVLDGRAAVLSADPTRPDSPSMRPVRGDSYRLREVDYGSVRDNTSAALTAAEPLRLDRRVRDLVVPGMPGREVVAEVSGIDAVSASSSGGDVRAPRGRGPEHQAWSAVDGDPSTAWVSGDVAPAVGQWWQVDLATPRDLGQVEIDLLVQPDLGPAPTRLRVVTDSGAGTVPVQPAEGAQPVSVPPGATRSLRFEVDEVSGGGAGQGVGLREVVLPDVEPRRTGVLPDPVEADAEAPAVIALRTADGWRPDCVRPADRPLCVPGLRRSGEDDAVLDRSFGLSAPAVYEPPRIRARPRPGPMLEALLDPDDGRIRATSTSRAVDDPAARAQALVDRDLGTGWVAAPADGDPTVSLGWGEVRRVRGVQVLVDPYLAATPATRVLLASGASSWSITLDDRGFARLPEPVETDAIDVRLEAAEPVVSVDPVGGGSSPLPVGASEIRVLGADDLRLPTPRTQGAGLPCGFGPPLVVDGRALTTQVAATVGDLEALRPVPVLPCGDDAERLVLTSGEHEVVLEATAETWPLSVVLEPVVAGDDPPGSPGRPVDVERWDQQVRSVALGASTRWTWLQVRENFSDGWQARLDGAPLQAVRLDGWTQGWLVPPGPAGVVTMEFTPGRFYRGGLVAGAFAVLVLLALAVVPDRRRPASPALPPARRTRTGTVLAALALAWTGGVVAVGLLVAVRVVASVRPAVVRLLAPTGVAVAGLLLAVDPWPPPSAHGSWPVALAALTGLAALTAVATSRRRARGDDPGHGP
ncbi:MAG TPA: alpha-(1-_3)-arabinofuranosyltransferase [Jiangellales bacterium]|nr:alpha-(1->3)-arabinofuranosyltransferase [Jiangellales bacterium]